MKYYEPSILDKNKQILIRIENFYLYSNFFNSLINSKKLMKILNDLTDVDWSLFKEKLILNQKDVEQIIYIKIFKVVGKNMQRTLFLY